MKPFAEFSSNDPSFWANIKLVSESLGYSDRKTGGLKRYSVENLIRAFLKRGLNYSHVYKEEEMSVTDLGREILSYLNKRSEIIEEIVQPNLMDRDEAKEEFERIRERVNPTCHMPKNKQKGEKKHYAYMTCLVNMLTEEALGGVHFDDNPKGLVLITKDGKPLRTFSRWMELILVSLILFRFGR